MIYFFKGNRCMGGASDESERAIQSGMKETGANSYLKDERIIDIREAYLGNGKVMQMPARPAEGGHFDYDRKCWVSDPADIELETLKKRAASYPPIGDQLDALFKAGAFPPEMAAKIAEVKARFPKA